MSTDGEVVHGLRAAAKLTGWSPSGIQRLVDRGRLHAEKNGHNFVFSAADLEAIRRDAAPPEALAIAMPIGRADTPAAALPPSLQSPGLPEAPPKAQLEPSTKGTADDGGAVASQVFADLSAGHSLTQIVIDRRLPPDVVRRVHAEWLLLGDVDVLKKPTAEARLAGAESDVATLDERLSAAEAAIEEMSAERGRAHEVERRVRSLEGREKAAGVPTTVLRRLETLEQQVRSMPATPMPIGRCCPGCGAAVIVATACGGCGLGRVA